MKRSLLALALVAPLVLGTAACGAWFTVDGFEVSYVDRPHVEGVRRWSHHGTVVYEHQGHYYREHQGRWVVYRSRPHDLQEYR